jgi:rod shape-determining protein MreC
MKNVFIFIWRYYFFFLFLALESFSIALLVDNNNFHEAGFYSKVVEQTSTIQEGYDQFFEYFRLKSVNDKLVLENSNLLNHKESSFFKVKKNDQFAINDTVYRQQYVYIPAKVINNSTGNRNNFITLNRGQLHGIKPDMAVINNEGIVGIVKDVSPNFASVISFLNAKSTISAKIKSTDYFGSCFWEGGNPKVAALKDIPSHAEVHLGDTIISSSYSKLFPEGITVGLVKKVDLRPGNNFYDIEISLSTNFQKINYVYVVKNLMKEEQENLETISQKQEK